MATMKYDFFHPQWNFGYGLSYTDFKFSNLRLSKKNISISKMRNHSYVDVENTGDIFGASCSVICQDIMHLFLH